MLRAPVGRKVEGTKYAPAPHAVGPHSAHSRRSTIRMPDAVPPRPPPPGAALLHLIHGYGVTQLIYVAAKLSLADRLSLQPQTSQELAAAVRVDPAALQRVLRGLAHSGVFAEQADGRFSLTPLGERL